MPATVELTVGHLQAVIIVAIGFCAMEHYRLIEILTDLTRFTTWKGKLFFLSLIIYTAAFTYCATDLSVRLSQVQTHHDCECPDCITQFERDRSPYELYLDPSNTGPCKQTSPQLFCQPSLLMDQSKNRSNNRGLIHDKSTSLATQISSAGAQDEDDDGLSPLLVPHCRTAPPVGEEGCPPPPRPQGSASNQPELESMPRTFIKASIPTARKHADGDCIRLGGGQPGVERNRSILKPSGNRQRRVSVVDYKEKKSSISVAFAHVKKGTPTALERMYKTLDDVDYDLINCKTLSLNIYIPLILGHASSFVIIAYAAATFPVYGWAAVPLLILAYAGLMNANSLLRHLVPKPTQRWVCVITLYVGLYYYRLRSALPPPVQFSATTGDLWSVLLIFTGTVLFGFYLAFALGCSLQSAMKHSTLQDWCGKLCSFIVDQ